ncbi:deoxyribodipyrimidine photo-lyase [Litoreibacter halocynthiae]|uniref:Deoxyribodipyrimidine photo-lyase n=1 Tax=Litoreibacter halocynthiae TaxID=1242689 RepID=A0A4R7LTX7_9RHOB|nr:deoxyribodipyrimidine photo-lyase [Litoreibacter halocynthiae]TDT77991.1 deoxyribodipyrimidine photo-lyase [Litoreibacter halocynthiae]
MSDTPILFWFRRDLRLGDHEGLSAAAATGRPVIPVFIHDEVVETHGAAPKWRLGLGVEHFAKTLEGIGSKLVLRRGKALDVLRDLVKETGAGAVWWSRAYDPDAIARDTGVKEALKDDGIDAQSFKGHVLFEPWTVETKTGGFYRVFSPMWKSVRGTGLAADISAVSELCAPNSWPASEKIDDWQMGAAMWRGADIVAKHVVVGEDAASTRLATFIRDRIDGYKDARDQMAVRGTSMLSENLTYGEISPRRCWHAGWRAVHEGKSGAETFLKELVWREFAYHLAYHTPRIMDKNWREEWDAFPWKDDERAAEIKAWKQGRTGIQLVDAAMREMYVTGYMHNRGRMIVASYLTKHLMTHWKVGQAWFDDCLIDWDPASNAMGWQWSAGSGPDATPYFRVFNPATQAEKFDNDRSYRARYLGELFKDHGEEAEDYFKAIPKSWNMAITDDYPKPVVALDEGRQRALDAYQQRKG